MKTLHKKTMSQNSPSDHSLPSGTARHRSIAVLCGFLAILAISTLQAGVLVGNSTLIDTLDYSDTLTSGSGYRDTTNYAPATPDGYYRVENNYSSPVVYWGANSQTMNFVQTSAYSGNTGASTGVVQVGAGERSFAYSLRTNYVIQSDGVLPGGGSYFEIGSYATSPSNNWGSASPLITEPTNLTINFEVGGAITLFGASTSPGVGTTTNSGFTTGLTDAASVWHNYAVGFNQTNHTLSLYVDQSLRGTLDTTTFAAGIYDNWSHGAAAVGTGGGMGYFDNVQVGLAVPEPSAMVLVGLSAIGLLVLRRYRARC